MNTKELLGLKVKEFRKQRKITQEKLVFRGQSDHCTGCVIDAEIQYTLAINFAESARSKALQIFRRST